MLKQKPQETLNRRERVANANLQSKLLFALQALLLLMAVFYVALFLYITAARIRYPFALEWMEGSSLVQVQRILAGQALYVEPSLDYIPLIYPPLYYYVSAAFAAPLGLGFFPLRFVSLLSMLGCYALIFSTVRKLQPDLFSQLVAVGLFSATFQIGGAWFDVARVDMLALFLTLASIYCLHFLKSANFFFAGLLMASACMTKQTYLAVALAAGIYAFFLDRKKAWIYAATSVLIYAAAFLLLDFLHGGWYRYFIFDLPQTHAAAFDVTSAGGLFWNAIFKPIGLMFLFAALYFIRTILKEKNYAQLGLIAVVGALVATSWLGIINWGGFLNVIVPTHAILSIVAGLFLSKTLADNAAPGLFKMGVLILVALQFVLLRYPIQAQIPTAEDLKSGEALVETIKQQPGEVYAPSHPELTLLAGKNSYAHWVGMAEIQGKFGSRNPEWNKIKDQLQKAFRTKRFAMIVVDADMSDFYGQPGKGYRQIREVAYPSPESFYPVTGWRVRPTTIYTIEAP